MRISIFAFLKTSNIVCQMTNPYNMPQTPDSSISNFIPFKHTNPIQSIELPMNYTPNLLLPYQSSHQQQRIHQTRTFLESARYVQC